MVEADLRIPRELDWSKVPLAVERCIAAVGLRMALRGTLKSYSESIHWHLKRDSESGTLEVTVWPGGRRVWCSVQSRRRAAWIDEMLHDFVQRLQHEISRPVP